MGNEQTHWWDTKYTMIQRTNNNKKCPAKILNQNKQTHTHREKKMEDHRRWCLHSFDKRSYAERALKMNGTFYSFEERPTKFLLRAEQMLWWLSLRRINMPKLTRDAHKPYNSIFVGDQFLLCCTEIEMRSNLSVISFYGVFCYIACAICTWIVDADIIIIVTTHQSHIFITATHGQKFKRWNNKIKHTNIYYLSFSRLFSSSAHNRNVSLYSLQSDDHRRWSVMVGAHILRLRFYFIHQTKHRIFTRALWFYLWAQPKT